MLRSLDEKGGIGVYTRNLVEELLALDASHDFVLLYRDPANLGRYGDHAQVTEVVLRGRNNAVWDQLSVPLACRRHALDVVVHPKFTVPFLAPCPTVMVVHGADWFLPEQARFYRWLDVRYVRTVMPWYFRKAAAVISVSKLTTSNFETALRLPPGKLHTIYFGPARHFRRIEFALSLTKRAGDGRKNLGGLLEGYARYHATAEQPLALVIGGKDCHLFRSEYGIPDTGWGADVHFPGWIDQGDLPALYSLARLYVYPSNLEAFPIPITEAMTCGTPVVTSNANGLEEIAGDAAILVDPDDPDAIARAIDRVNGDEALRRQLVERGLARSTLFRWERCARETLDLIERVVAEPPAA
jgi:glycosyltransferase involved in cell wall biosynthesis